MEYNTVKYKEFLSSWDWKTRSSEIVLRDKFHCRDCGKMGMHYAYFKFSTIDDIQNYLPTPFLLNGMDIGNFCEISFKNISRSIDIFHVILNHDLKAYSPPIKIYSSIIEVFYNAPFLFISENDIELLKFKMIGKIHNHIRLELNAIKAETVLHTLITNQEISNNNYILIEPLSINGITCTLAITITIKPNKILYFYSPINPFVDPLPTLEVHHLSYPNSNDPLDCDDSNLITLCHDCHKKRHNII